MSYLETLIEKITEKCWRAYFSSTPVYRCSAIRALPWNTDLTYEGIPLSTIISPPGPTLGENAEALLEAWVWPQFSGVGDHIQEFKAYTKKSYKDIFRFITYSSDNEERLFRLIYVLSKAKGATVLCDEQGIMINHDDCSFGIIDGIVHSRFCTGFTVKGSYWEWAHTTPRFISRNGNFNLIWREAIRQGIAPALTALYQGYPGTDWSGIREQGRYYKLPTTIQRARWLSALRDNDDPIGELYNNLVPDFMTRTTFNRIICDMTTRPYIISEKLRVGYANRLDAYFDNTLEKVKQW